MFGCRWGTRRVWAVSGWLPKSSDYVHQDAEVVHRAQGRAVRGVHARIVQPKLPGTDHSIVRKEQGT